MADDARTQGNTQPRVQRDSSAQVRIDAGYGRLYVTGASSPQLATLPGAAYNTIRRAYELSLTIETLRAIRRTLNMTQSEMARSCTDVVLRWARAAGSAERVVNEVHRRIDAGERIDVPWRDTTGHPITGEYRPPYDHQKIMASAAAWLDGWAIVGEVGTGKTRAALEAAQKKIRDHELDHLFVVCPNRVSGTWMRAVPMWTPLLIPIRLEGTLSERIETLRRSSSGSRKVFILNYEMFDRMSNAISGVASRKAVGIVFDEGHRIRNPIAKVTRAAMRIATLCKWRGILTGTLVLNGGHDVWAPWYVVDFGTAFGANFVQFKREHFIENAFTHSLDPRRGALDVIGQRTHRRGLFFKKDECLDLPPQIFETEEVDMSNEQWHAYNEMAAQLVTHLDTEAATAATQLVAMLRLMQITSGHIKTERGSIYRFQPNPKMIELNEIVRDNIINSQVIVWAHYREDMDWMLERFRDLNPVFIRGGMTLAASELAQQQFQAGESRLMLGQPGAGGAGIDLYNADLAIYYSQGYSREHRAQSEGRNHRPGSEIHSRITYIDLICRNTVDEIVSSSLQHKKDVAAVVEELRHHLLSH